MIMMWYIRVIRPKLPKAAKNDRIEGFWVLLENGQLLRPPDPRSDRHYEDLDLKRGYFSGDTCSVTCSVRSILILITTKDLLAPN